MAYDQFNANVQQARKKVGANNEGSAWFRGISNGRHKLVPSLLRYKSRHHQSEINIFADFWTKIDGYNLTDNWQRLSLMQHFGLPTRLLDWTDNLNVALYFAICYADAKRTGDPYIWILNPFKLNYKFCGNNVVYDAVDEPPFDYYRCALTGVFPNTLPISLRPLWSNGRVRAQAGAFTFHATDDPLEESVSTDILRSVRIDHADVLDFRKYLIDRGTNHYTMLGGPDGLSRYLKNKYL